MTALVVRHRHRTISSLTKASESARPAHGMRIRRAAAFAVPEFDPQTTAVPPDNILRWEHGGGTVVEVCDPRLCRQDLLAKGSLRR